MEGAQHEKEVVHCTRFFVELHTPITRYIIKCPPKLTAWHPARCQADLGLAFLAGEV